MVPLSFIFVILKEYLKETKEFESEYLFLTYEGKPLSPDTIRWSLRRIGEAANITKKRLSPHTFRIRERYCIL